MKRVALMVLMVAMTASAPASAQDRYRSWSDPDAPGGNRGSTHSRTDALIDRLKRLVEDAERARAADPLFLRDLRDLIREFDAPGRRQLLFDDFRDGDFQRNPRWRVIAGEWWVERNWGLRSAVGVGADAPAGESRELKGKEAAAAILGMIIEQATRGDGDGSAPSAVPAMASIALDKTLPNAFDIELEFSSWQPQGRLDLGVYQGRAGGPGYALAYNPGGGFTLLRVIGGGASVIDKARGPFSLEDRKSHQLTWSRGADGAMTVRLDGREILRATDRGFRDPFDGFLLTNRGGDYILKSISIYGLE